ncbi:unnamed protein product [Lupinus luteus]|uniref:Reverse transcriptase zinc-binding domain-containing protein n=1 Tax=Lupinus luteus TaxID=3873 RepID=A0AAV1XHZ6_LUPLU
MIRPLLDPASRWWKDLDKIGFAIGNQGGWMDLNVWKEIGNGESTLFWYDIWFGNERIKDMFLRFFLLAENRNALVADYGTWRNDLWNWRISWRRTPLSWEEASIDRLLTLINCHGGRRALRGRLAIKDGLFRRQITVGVDMNCVLCMVQTESTNHLLLAYPFAIVV